MRRAARNRGFGPYRHVDDYLLIELTLREVRELFSTLDPAPFGKKDLDADAEAYIVGAMRELGPRQRVKLILYLPRAELVVAQTGELTAAIHNYFAYRADQAVLDLRQLFGRGLVSALIAFLFMSACLWLRQSIGGWPGPIVEVLREGLVILAWVALWRPTEIFLYDWWPIWRQGRLLQRIARMPIEVAERAGELRQEPIAAAAAHAPEPRHGSGSG